MTGKLEKLRAGLDSLVVFRSLLKSGPLASLSRLLETGSVRDYCDFVGAVYDGGFDLSKQLLDAAADDDNIYVRLAARGEPVPEVLRRCVENELVILGAAAALSPAELSGAVRYDGFLPEYETTELDFPAEYMRRMENLSSKGYGIYARHTMFAVRDGAIEPVRSPDRVEISGLIGYSRQRRQVVDNTRALLRGLPALNVLLYGDAGTGKSTTVKAVTNQFAGEGLRLVEMRKDQLRELPGVMAELSENPLKFIIFIDDLSFSADDDSFGTLKAILEGSGSARAGNTAIYATSNRRHLVRENFSARDGDDVHRRDTIQEQASLSERFGLTVLYSAPNKTEYLEIVRGLAERKAIKLPVEELESGAEAFALEKGGRSARCAEQYTNRLLAEQNQKELE